MKKQTFVTGKIKKKASFSFATFSTIFVLCGSTPACGQTTGGAAVLTMMPGSRQHAMANTSGAVLDDIYGVYGNPALAAHVRAWQWAASYTKWIAEVSQASIFYGRRFRSKSFRETGVTLGVLYQGIPEFDNTAGQGVAVSASDFVILAGAGAPLLRHRRDFSFGVAVKYLHSKLANFISSAWMADAGVLYRVPRFRLPWTAGGMLEYGIVSAGISLSNFGEPLRYSAHATSLPRTVRAGIAFLAGAHTGLRFALALDYRKIRKEPGSIALGAELGWRDLIHLRTGYDFARNLLSHYALGFSLSLNRTNGVAENILPGRNSALRLNFASAQGNELFARTYRGDASLYDAGPEAFDLIEPACGAIIPSGTVHFAWEKRGDNDLLDSVHYRVMIDRDSLALVQAIERRLDPHADHRIPGELFAVHVTGKNDFTLPALPEGWYYWTVIAEDADGYGRPAWSNGRSIFRFLVPSPDIEITGIDFMPRPQTSPGPDQGTITVHLVNHGPRAVEQVVMTLDDSLLQADLSNRSRPIRPTSPQKAVLRLLNVGPGEMRVATLEWHAAIPGLHRLTATAIGSALQFELNTANNQRSEQFFTIPRGVLITDDTVTTQILSTYMFDLPFVADVYFDSSSAEVKESRARAEHYKPLLEALAARLRAKPEAKVTLQGFADPSSGESRRALADARAQAVRARLLQLGARPEQLLLLPGKVLPPRRLPANPDDRRWILQERRVVHIRADKSRQEMLFQPAAHMDRDLQQVPVTFILDFESAAPLRSGKLVFRGHSRSDTLDLQTVLEKKRRVRTTVGWHPPGGGKPGSMPWAGQAVAYQLTLEDSLGRAFTTAWDSTFLAVERNALEKKVIWPLKFGDTQPLYDFYWERLYRFIDQLLAEKDVYMRFEGHACAIGPEVVNLRLSQRRARTFEEKFLAFVKSSHPEAYEKIRQRLYRPRAFGESRPLHIHHDFCNLDLQFGNETPIERKFNRRIEIVFYQSEQPRESFGRGYAIPAKAEEE